MFENVQSSLREGFLECKSNMALARNLYLYFSIIATIDTLLRFVTEIDYNIPIQICMKHILHIQFTKRRACV
jgi:hypothetical protein